VFAPTVTGGFTRLLITQYWLQDRGVEPHSNINCTYATPVAPVTRQPHFGRGRQQAKLQAARSEDPLVGWYRVRHTTLEDHTAT
jgi:hypothetical protein